MKPHPLYRLEVAPLIILPLTRSPLWSYLSRTPVTPGSLVRIPFGSQEAEGVVFASDPFPGRAPNWMKYIREVKESNYLTPEQLALAENVSETYLTPLGKTLKHFIPTKAKARKKKLPEAKTKVLRAKKEETRLLGIWKKHRNVFLDTSLLPDASRLYFLIAQAGMKSKKQTLILVPEVSLLAPLLDVARNFFKEDSIALLESHLAPGVYSDAWERIREGKASLILATRQGLFAPFKNLGNIILTEEQDESYKQWDMAPRYQGKTVAASLRDLWNAKLLLASPAASLETMALVEQKEFTPLFPPSKKPLLKGQIVIVNLRLERYQKNFSPFSKILQEKIRETLAKKEQVLHYIHKRGMSSFSVCEQCKSIFRCPVSGHALQETSSGAYRCPWCDYTTGLFPSCPSCKHIGFRHVGFGTERIEREVKKSFPGARMFRADGSTMRLAGAQEKLYQKGLSGEIDILIGTQMVLKAPPLPDMGLVAIIDADSLLAGFDFRSDERFLQYLAIAAANLAARGKRTESLVVQTFHPESLLLQKTQEESYWDIAGTFENDRESLFYPPFSRLIALTEISKKKTPKKTEGNLPEALLQDIPGIRIQKRPATDKLPTAFFLRIPPGDLSEPLSLALQKLSSDYLIDIDPLSFS